MSRFRTVPTRMTSTAHLVRALNEAGFAEVERFDQPEPLMNWLGKPTDMRAHIVLRRKFIGSTGDDLGFVRAANGTFDALLSEIHLYRFNQKWLRELEQRYDVLAAAEEGVERASNSLPARAQVASMPAASPKPPSRDAPKIHEAPISAVHARPRKSPAHVAPIPPPLPEENVDEVARGLRAVFARVEVERARRSLTGKLIFFVPLAYWIVVAIADDGRGMAAGFGLVIAVWAIGGFAYITSRAARIAKAGADEFNRRFPPGSVERGAALGRFKSMKSGVDGKVGAHLTQTLRRIAGVHAHASQRQRIAERDREEERFPL